MRQLRDAHRLALEPRHRRVVPGHRVGEHFDRDLAIEPRIPGPVHLAHAAGAEQRDDFVRTETGTGRQRHRG